MIFAKLVYAFQLLCFRADILLGELETIQNTIETFIIFLENEICISPELNVFCKANTHQLLHLVESVKNCGVPSSNWQYG